MHNNSSALPVYHELRDEFNRYAIKVNHVLMFLEAVICFSGILGNLLALIVINRKSLRHTSSAVFITYLAIFDSAVLLTHAATLFRPRRNLFLHCSLTYLTELTTFNANWILVIITLGKFQSRGFNFPLTPVFCNLERCIAVYSPFLAKRLCTVHSARRSMYILLSVSFLFFSLTFPFIYHQNEALNNRKCSVRLKYKLLIRIYQPIVMYGLPALFLLSNLFTVYALFNRHRQLSLMNSHDERKSEIRISDLHSSRKQRQLTIMLITVSLSFYLFTAPAMIVYIREFFPTKHRQLSKMKQDFLFSQISVLLLQLNNAVS